MSKRRWWRAAAVIFIAGNAASVIYHVAIGEMRAAMGHAALAIGTLVFWLSVSSRKREPANTAAPSPVNSELDHIQRTLDGIALEVERLGEGQRFAQKVLEARRLGDNQSQQ